MKFDRDVLCEKGAVLPKLKGTYDQSLLGAELVNPLPTLAIPLDDPAPLGSASPPVPIGWPSHGFLL